VIYSKERDIIELMPFIYQPTLLLQSIITTSAGHIQECIYTRTNISLINYFSLNINIIKINIIKINILKINILNRQLYMHNFEFWVILCSKLSPCTRIRNHRPLIGKNSLRLLLIRIISILE
jgi:hypothetical protein